ncbi:MAG TPA: bifunctional diaminohydroxyphosphoribosylaminopyrimidine deaminase/5-amino-6-(5-phosphoribosylamino)uracil reductase RibD [Gemmatimonadales bacterium]|nr:bifunctional diaminohydroxyphosphoribosylaminopyrimidine deaminase/5-amino-6-(5-phosphoribosylamino)uracil reductase RibD [Gemmatimonadales bacterium]
MDEREAMTRALEIAWRGWGRVAPNPLVGAVLLNDGMVVGEGWHQEYGSAHAEMIALSAAGPRARGATLVVTLEPCAHQGKQPPCAPAVLAAGVSRVVAALADPNPEAQGGAAWLSQSGVPVEIGLMSSEACRQNGAFLHRFRNKERPFVALKLATTIDGRIADLAGHSRWISGSIARDYVHWLRAGFDAIASGGHTARVDDSSLTVRGEIEPRQPPVRVLFDSRGDLPRSLKLVRSADQIPTWVVVSPTAPTIARTSLESAGVKVMVAGTLTEGMAQLRAEGIESMIVEGGGRLGGALLAEGLVDRFHWIQSPLWLGDEGVPAFSGVPGYSVADAARWTVVERRPLGEDTLLVLDREPCSPES